VFDEKLDAKTFMYHLGDERNRMAGKPPVRAAAPAFVGGDRLCIEPVTLPLTVSYPGLKPFIQRAEIARHEQPVAAAGTALTQAREGLAAAKKNEADIEAQADLKRPIPPAVRDARTKAAERVRAGEALVPSCEAHLATARAELQSVRARVAA